MRLNTSTNSTAHKIKTFYINTNHPRKTSTAFSSSSSHGNSYYNDFLISKAVRHTSQSQLTNRSKTTSDYLTVIPERLVKSAPPMQSTNQSIVAVYSHTDAKNRKDASYVRTKIHYVDMAAVYPSESENDSISLISNPTVFVSEI